MKNMDGEDPVEYSKNFDASYTSDKQRQAIKNQMPDSFLQIK